MRTQKNLFFFHYSARIFRIFERGILFMFCIIGTLSWNVCELVDSNFFEQLRSFLCCILELGNELIIQVAGRTMPEEGFPVPVKVALVLASCDVRNKRL